MSIEYPELRGKTVDAEALMVWIFKHHDHADPERHGDRPYVDSLDLENWLRADAIEGSDQ